MPIFITHFEHDGDHVEHFYGLPQVRATHLLRLVTTLA
jgi:hypothetical protein